uniref:Uncharacterized protein n=1 Tax=Paramoeba aestuarina TaxID=180227 RepID=A0A7S4L8T2_9EUKA|eukprot:CAMPEP_0201520162 /NCGR_PEP_ID=MMETSP0161_2-20130828/10533_1 /ASSEMBLY_ACC=CAM_ASM_000251 /TAXON_ID=180227 /ORGANISM="Neoparamoeba aestuarina, Strain SoJaBio B1-5/56/2" /LENGTH=365 /DNA_ID=CAMNT_0047918441 /DNA_START=27 /DNA_END=1124 /DNA_ORIENTATION=+
MAANKKGVVERLDQHMQEMLGSNPNAATGENASRKRKREDADVCVALDVSVLSSLILQGFEVYINKKLHTILEVELYVTSDAHPDPFTHCNEVQKQGGKWYFHRSGTGGGNTGYRGGSFKGLDIAIGGEGRVGGCLIRTIRRESDKHVITGPSKTVDHILETCGAKNIQEFVDDTCGGDIDIATCPLLNVKISDSWDPKNLPKKDPVFVSPRFGLNPINKKGSEDLIWWYLYQPYRFVRQPSLFSKARVNTVLGHYQTTGEKLSAQSITHLTGGTLKAAEGYIDLYNKGTKDKKCLEKNFNSKLNSSTWCTCYGAAMQLFPDNKGLVQKKARKEEKEGEEEKKDEKQQSPKKSPVKSIDSYFKKK